MSINYHKKSIIKSNKVRTGLGDEFKYPVGIAIDTSKPGRNIAQGNIMSYLDTSTLGVHANGKLGNFQILDGPTGGNVIVTYANTVGNYFFKSNQAISNIEVLAVAGGGCGGRSPHGSNAKGGGGGAGGVVYYTDNQAPYNPSTPAPVFTSNTGTTYFDPRVDSQWTIKVGFGGFFWGMSGQNTTISGNGIDIVAVGGGGGAGPGNPPLCLNPQVHQDYPSDIIATHAKPGGSGGGRAWNDGSPYAPNYPITGLGVPGQGYPGGNGGPVHGSGGGGAAGQGGSIPSGGPNPNPVGNIHGGEAVLLSISGTPRAYGGGGGGTRSASGVPPSGAGVSGISGRVYNTYHEDTYVSGGYGFNLGNENYPDAGGYWSNKDIAQDPGIRNRGGGSGGYGHTGDSINLKQWVGGGGSGIVILSFPVLQNTMVIYEGTT